MVPIKNIPYLLALHSIDGLGPLRLKKILDYFNDPKLAWDANKGIFLKLGIPDHVADNIIRMRQSLDPQRYVEAINQSATKWVTIFDENYPTLLKQIYDPPVVLFYKGEILGDERAIAVVGTRKMTSYGQVVTSRFTRELVNRGFTIVSGLARGVDSQAHKEALASSGRTIAVLGGGLNKIYPPENISLAEKIVQNKGALISEFPPNEPSLPGNFPSRNRIISGLSIAILVTEAASDSGSLITARLGIEQGKDIFAIPGSISSPFSKGPLDLIKEGARVVFEPKDILEELGVRALPVKVSVNNNLSSQEKQVLEVLENDSVHIDVIGRMLNLNASQIAATLLKMELSGLVRNLGSGVYAK